TTSITSGSSRSIPSCLACCGTSTSTFGPSPISARCSTWSGRTICPTRTGLTSNRRGPDVMKLLGIQAIDGGLVVALPSGKQALVALPDDRTRAALVVGERLLDVLDDPAEPHA